MRKLTTEGLWTPTEVVRQRDLIVEMCEWDARVADRAANGDQLAREQVERDLYVSNPHHLAPEMLRAFYRSLAVQIAGGSLYLVTEEMAELTSHAARSWPGQSLLRSDLPEASGLALLGNPLPTKLEAIGGKGWIGVAWTQLRVQGRGGMVFHIFDYSDDMAPAARECGVPGLRCWYRCSAGPVAFGDDIRSLAERGRKRADVEERPSSDEVETTVFHELFTLAFWTLSQQRLVIVEPGDVPRQVQRQMERAGRPPSASDVRVVRLRRRAPTEGDASGESVDWSHRWLVSGHWQRYHTKEGTRLQWKVPYVKGPEDKPLVVRPTVKAWVR